MYRLSSTEYHLALLKLFADARPSARVPPYTIIVDNLQAVFRMYVYMHLGDNTYRRQVRRMATVLSRDSLYRASRVEATAILSNGDSLPGKRRDYVLRDHFFT